ncbi:hypothetical protein QQP08_018817 [Theobroma cacao]|nr:hypothetical protein QQP08_018817 [Theobroma cacao]
MDPEASNNASFRWSTHRKARNAVQGTYRQWFGGQTEGWAAEGRLSDHTRQIYAPEGSLIEPSELIRFVITLIVQYPLPSLEEVSSSLLCKRKQTVELVEY